MCYILLLFLTMAQISTLTHTNSCWRSYVKLRSDTYGKKIYPYLQKKKKRKDDDFSISEHTLLTFGRARFCVWTGLNEFHILENIYSERVTVCCQYSFIAAFGQVFRSTNRYACLYVQDKGVMIFPGRQFCQILKCKSIDKQHSSSDLQDWWRNENKHEPVPSTIFHQSGTCS